MHDSHVAPAPGSGPIAEVPADDAQEVVGALLSASRLLVAMAARSVAAVEENLTLPQYRMLVVLDAQGPRSLARLAQALEVNSSTAMRMVDRLAAAGMAEKIPSPDSRREVVLRLTAAGHAVVEKVTERRVDAITRTVQAIPADQREHLITALRAFTDAGGEPADALPDLPGWS
jgi:DNA-binding MarR family transcriptional regulator